MRAFEALISAGVVAAEESDTWSSLLRRFRVRKLYNFSSTRYGIETVEMDCLVFKPVTCAGMTSDQAAVRGTVTPAEDARSFTVQTFVLGPGGWKEAGKSTVQRLRVDTLDQLQQRMITEISKHVKEAVGNSSVRYPQSQEPATIKITGPGVDMQMLLAPERLPDFQQRLRDLECEFRIRA